MQLSDHTCSPRLARDALVLGPSAALNSDPTATSSVDNDPQAVPQLCVPQQSSTSQTPRLVSRSGQLQEQGFSVEVAEGIAAPQWSSTRTIYKSSGPFLKNRWISPLCETNLRVLHVPVPRQAPLDHLWLQDCHC